MTDSFSFNWLTNDDNLDERVGRFGRIQGVSTRRTRSWFSPDNTTKFPSTEPTESATNANRVRRTGQRHSDDTNNCVVNGG
uniref:Uncharacterized protein n=1 Tax=Trichuris muris TaxID=70415 RepID=A0A5S6Q7Y6_TRIMR